MADYWKSQPKKFCQYCKCWIADNKPSVEFHERGKNHKENVAAKITEIKQKSLDKAKQEKRTSKEFAAMEEAALKAYEQDMKRMQMESGSDIQVQTPVPPQPSIKREEKPKKQASRKNNPKNKPRVSKDWVEGKSDDGHMYYYNRMTGESQWEKPEGFQGGSSAASQLGQNEGHGSAGCAWMEAVSPDGYTYYYNTETGASSWERPAGLGPSAEGESPQPEPPGVGESSSGTQASKEADGSDQGEQQSNVPKISFRKRKAETESSEKEEEDNAESVSQSKGVVEGGGETQKMTAVTEEKEMKKKEEEEKKRKEEEEEVKKRQMQAKKRKVANPYGVWERIQEEDDPFVSVDLQLPQTDGDDAPAPEVLQPPPEAKPKFKERTITSLGGGGGPASFRKSRAQNSKARSLRQRGKED